MLQLGQRVKSPLTHPRGRRDGGLWKGNAMADDADSGVRQLVLVHGRDRARAMVEPEKKALVDIAAQVLSDDEGKIGISYSGFCLTGLPHKALPDDAVWEKRGHRVTLLVAPGQLPGRGGKTVYVGVPYGARAHDPAVSADPGDPHRLARSGTRSQHARLAWAHGALMGRQHWQDAA